VLAKLCPLRCCIQGIKLKEKDFKKIKKVTAVPREGGSRDLAIKPKMPSLKKKPDASGSCL
jgi:hypothetical protein